MFSSLRRRRKNKKHKIKSIFSLEQLDKLSTYPDKLLDDLFAKHTDLVFQTTDCLSCANCCRNYSPIIEPEEIPKLMMSLGIDSNVLFDKYIEMDEDGDFVFQSQPCPLLDLNTNKCNIYDNRPNSCREYPHTNMKKIKNHFDLLEKNIEICPAAKSILDQVELSLPESL